MASIAMWNYQRVSWSSHETGSFWDRHMDVLIFGQSVVVAFTADLVVLELPTRKPKFFAVRSCRPLNQVKRKHPLKVDSFIHHFDIPQLTQGDPWVTYRCFLGSLRCSTLTITQMRDVIVNVNRMWISSSRIGISRIWYYQ